MCRVDSTTAPHLDLTAAEIAYLMAARDVRLSPARALPPVGPVTLAYRRRDGRRWSGRGKHLGDGLLLITDWGRHD